MPIRFFTSPYQASLERKADVRRLLHIAFDFGYLFEPAEIEAAWLAVNENQWAPLPEKDVELWFQLQKNIEAAIIEGTNANQLTDLKTQLITS